MKRQAGFTLIELLCALTILALVLAVSLRILSGGTAAAAAGKDYSQALAVAQAHLLSLESREKLVPGELRGKDGDIGWHEKVSAAEGPAFAGAAALKLLAWRVDADSRTADGRKVALTSVKLEPMP